MSASDLDSIAAFFTPRRVALMGASSDTAKFGGRLLTNLRKSGFAGEIYPINRTETEVQGLKAYASLSDLPVEVDLVLVTIPAQAVPGAIAEAQSVNARAAVVYAAGFGEAKDGLALHEELLASLKKGRLRMIGPNCMGVRNFHPPMNASNSSAATDDAGPIALLLQSGSFGNAAYAALKSLRAGLSIYASIGNMVNVSHADLIRYCGGDRNTGVIAAFIEGIPDIGDLLDAVREVAPAKPVLVLKAGSSPFGQRASLSHTGSLAVDSAVATSLLRESGAVVVDNMQDLFDAAAGFAHIGDALPRGRRTAIFSVSGGPSVIAADHCHQQGLELPPLEERLASLRPIVPSYAALGNPVEVTGSTRGQAFVTCATTLAAQDVIDSMIAISIGMDVPEFGQGVVAARAVKPVVGCATGANLPGVFMQNGIPNYPSPERAVKVMRHLADRGCDPLRADAPRGRALAPRGLPAGKHGEAASKAYLAGYGLPVTREEEAHSLAQALDAAGRIGYPVALKVSSPEIAHKTDLGGVLLGLPDAAALRAAHGTLAARFPGKSVLVQEMVAPGLELIIGAKRSPSTGAIVMLGIGGVFAEMLDDVAFCRAPAARANVLAALSRLRGRRLLHGMRGQPAVDLDAVAAIAESLSGIVAGDPSIREIDLDPVIASSRGAVIVDALILTGEVS